MSLFGGLYVGTSGLKTAQNSLNTVAHNLSNVNTEGYVRQQVATTDVHYTTLSYTQGTSLKQVGDGVQYSECRHVRDYFLDQRYREESGRTSFYEVSYSAIMEIEDILGELDGAAFNESLQGMWTAFEELSKTPSDATYISLLVSNASTFMTNAQAVFSSLVDYQGNLNSQIVTMVDNINSIGTQIADLNNQIAIIESGGKEHANDLRDKRDLLLDQLAEYGNVTYSEDTNGKLSIRFNDVDFVTDYGAYKMGMWVDNVTGFSHPYWEQNVTYTVDENGETIPDYSRAQIFDVTEEISTDRGTDVGGLRGLLLARGDHTANYTDLQPDLMTKQKLKSMNITKNQYDEDAGLEYYNDYISGSIMMNAQAEFDNLVHHVVTTVNEVLATNADPKSGYLCNADGTPMQMFLKTFTEPYVKDTTSYTAATVEEAAANSNGKIFAIYDEDGNPTGEAWVYMEEDPDYKESLYNCLSLQINQELVQTPAKLGFVHEDSSTDYPIGAKFLEEFQSKQLYLNPNATAMSSFTDTYIEMVNNLSIEGNVFKSLHEYQQLATEQADANRQTVIGTSSDEELERMIMYQNAYNAASRYINVINTLLDSVISMGA